MEFKLKPYEYEIFIEKYCCDCGKLITIKYYNKIEADRTSFQKELLCNSCITDDNI